MPRGPRFDAPGIVQHVIQRGVERRTTFLDDADRHEYLRRAGEILPDEGVRCLAWVLMPNHVHLVLQTGRRPVARAMHRIGTGYSMYFNRRHGRVGHLVQNRFRSRPARDDDDVKNLIRYVHRNPLRAEIVASLADLRSHPWSGHGALVGALGAEPFHDVTGALAYFGDRPRVARARLRDWMAGDEGAWAHAFADEPAPTDSSAARTTLLRWRDELCTIHRVDPAALVAGSKTRDVARVRRMLAVAGIERLRLSSSEVGRVVGVTGSAVLQTARAARRGRSCAEAGG
jgi:REP element-mobilizing transposase RayT